MADRKKHAEGCRSFAEKIRRAMARECVGKNAIYREHNEREAARFEEAAKRASR